MTTSPPDDLKKDHDNGNDGRAAKMALIISTGLALVELVEKAVTYYPALIRALESFIDPTGNKWNHKETLRELRAVAEYKRGGSINELVAVAQSLPFGRGEVRNKTDADKVSVVLLIHNIALTHWASRSVLEESARHGIFRIARRGRFRKEEKDALLEIYKTCAGIPFIDELRPHNFLSMWG